MNNNKSIANEFYKQKVLSIFGCIFLTIGFWVLFSNEAKAIRHSQVLDEVLNTVNILNPNEPMNKNLDSTLVYISAPIHIEEPLTEPEYGISVQAVKLKRRVQMFQWIEEETTPDYSPIDAHTDAAQKNYYYYTDWREKLIDSSRFYMRAGHENPRNIHLKSHVQIADVVKIGPLTLSLPVKLKFTDSFEITSDERPERQDIKLHMGLYYHTDDIWNPEVGDIRIQFSYAGPSGQEVTIVGQQQGNSIVPYLTKDNVEVLMVRPLTHTLEEMFNMEHGALRHEMWKTRGFGWFLLFISTNCVAEIVYIIVSRLPIFKNVIALDSTIYTNITVSLTTTILIISFSWIMQKPIFALGCLIMAIAPYIYFSTININTPQYVRGNYNRM
ncbi:transmembrane protein 43 homolog [Chrysoperla carnea]|uniref:transmembrane protein 43 homolog n=1 Tax=Chrysoperla carnea TaxID=189513 RepID=UPI001D07BC8C|nr:transmembrane protein 43 homolog [Chrysoperla carnea]